jgi:hypothetical protein
MRIGSPSDGHRIYFYAHRFKLFTLAFFLFHPLFLLKPALPQKQLSLDAFSCLLNANRETEGEIPILQHPIQIFVLPLFCYFCWHCKF